MPTGYTAEVCNGKISDFPTFAMICARAFGALITMRDDPSDAAIPEAFKPSTYNADRLVEAKERLQSLYNMSNAEADEAALAAYEEARASRDKSDRERVAENARLDSMIAKVQAWIPPTEEHQEMKKFMVEQLTISKTKPYSWPAPVLMSGSEWRVEQIAKAKHDIEYHEAEQTKENERAAGRTKWVNELRKSLAA